jgi:hydroxymethylpyrimidine pyrophosphatase-like HAD family hydrolase
MHLTILASDLDGTLAEDGHVSPATWEALRAAKAAHLTLVLVTGRIQASFTPDGPFAELFDDIVAEDGAVVYFPRQMWWCCRSGSSRRTCWSALTRCICRLSAAWP